MSVGTAIDTLERAVRAVGELDFDALFLPPLVLLGPGRP